MYREYRRKMGCGTSTTTASQQNHHELESKSTVTDKSNMPAKLNDDVPKAQSTQNPQANTMEQKDVPGAPPLRKPPPYTTQHKDVPEAPPLRKPPAYSTQLQSNNATIENKPKNGTSEVSGTPATKTLTAEEIKKKQREELQELKKKSDELLKMINDTMAAVTNSVKNDPVIQGDVSKEFPLPAKIIRIFTSSTFTDTKYERNRLMEKTFPNLKSYCQQNGYEFQIVDMRWGVRDEAANDHMTVDICLQELANCQKYSAGPNILTLLSHKYGYRSVPREIEEDTFEKIYKYVDFSDQRQLLSKWFVKDENSVPPKYILQPISTHLPDFILFNDKDKQAAAKSAWWKESDAMLETLIMASEKALTKEEAYKFKISVTHRELMYAILNSDQDVAKKCLWFKRNITDIEQQEASNLLSKFMECTGSAETLGTVKKLISDLKTDMTKKLPAENILSYDVKWQEKGIDPNNKEHSEYLDKIAEGIEKKLKQMIDPVIIGDKKKRPDPVREECKQHLLFCRTKCEDFEGKKDTLETVQNYMKSDKKHALVIHGESGSGKTSLMAMIAKKAFQWFDGKATVVLRFLGTTPKSSNLLDLLMSLTKQIRSAKCMDPLYPKTIQEVELTFRITLKQVKDPLVIVLDSLDQLDTSYNARSALWIPPLLNPHVKFIVSTLEDSKYEAFPSLKNRVPPEGFIPVATISRSDVSIILDHWLKKKERKLTPTQRDLLLNAYDQCPLPLYLNLSFLEASQWTSYLDVSNIQLYKTIREAINGLFAKMELLHGEIFVSKTLGYLTAAKLGLTETELEDILACDDEVLNDVYVYWTPPIRRLPPLLLVRLRHDLQQYLVERGADGATVIYWYHRQFTEAAQERYCTDETSVTKLHTGLAEFFSGNWANGKKKPFVNRNGESGLADRHVVAQPIKFGDTYNMRKLNNLPYHQAMSGKVKELKEECLLNLEFLIAKLQCTSYRALIEDYQVAKKMSNDKEFDLLLQGLQLSEDAILFNPEQFMPQMFLRLADVKELKSFTDACREPRVQYLSPDKEILTKVGGPLIYALAGHKYQVEWVDIRKDGRIAVTVSNEDHTIGVWDIKEGKPIRMLEQIARYPTEAHFVVEDAIILVYSEKLFIGITELGEKLYSFPHGNMKAFSICGKKKDIAVFFMKNRSVFLYDLKTGEKVGQIDTPEELKKITTFGLFSSGSENYAICTCNDDRRVWVVDLVNQQLYCSEKIIFPKSPAIAEEEEEDVTIDALAVTKDGKYVILSNMYDNIPHFFDIKTFKVCRSFPGDEDDTMQTYKLSMDGKYMYGPSHGDVVLVDMETGQRCKALRHSSNIESVATVDVNIFVTVSNDSVVRVWDTSRSSTYLQKAPDLGKSGKMRGILPNGRDVVLSIDVKKERKLIVYDTIDNKIVSHASYQEVNLSKEMVFVDDHRALITLEDDNTKQMGIHVIDLDKMVTTPVQGKMNKDAKNLIKVNYGKEFMVPTRSGKNLKFYSMKTLKVTDIMKLPEELNQRIDMYNSTNYNGTMAVVHMKDDKHAVVIDVEERKIVKILDCKTFKLEDLGSDYLIPNNKNFIVITGMKDVIVNTMFLFDLKQDKFVKELTDFEYEKRYKLLKNDNDLVDMSSAVLLDDERIFSSHDDKFLRCWSTSQGALLKRIPGHRTSMSNIYYDPVSPYILTHGHFEERTLRLWDKETYQQVASFRTDEDISDIKWCKGGRTFVGINNNPCIITRWTMHGQDIQKDTQNYPVVLKGNVNSSSDVPHFDFKEVEDDPDDLDKEEQAPESEEEDDDDDDE